MILALIAAVQYGTPASEIFAFFNPYCDATVDFGGTADFGGPIDLEPSSDPYMTSYGKTSYEKTKTVDTERQGLSPAVPLLYHEGSV